MAVLASQKSTTTGMLPTYNAGAASQEIPNPANTIIHVKATGALTVTLKGQLSFDGVAMGDKVNTLTTGQEKIIGPFPSPYWNANGNVTVTLDTPANGTIAVYTVGL